MNNIAQSFKSLECEDMEAYNAKKGRRRAGICIHSSSKAFLDHMEMMKNASAATMASSSNLMPSIDEVEWKDDHDQTFILF